MVYHLVSSAPKEHSSKSHPKYPKCWKNLNTQILLDCTQTDIYCCKAATYSCAVASLGMIDSCCLYVFPSVFNNLQSDFGQRLFKWYWDGWNLLLLATKENLHKIPVVPLLTNSVPINWFVMHRNSMTVNCGTREWTCATNMMRSTHW